MFYFIIIFITKLQLTPVLDKTCEYSMNNKWFPAFCYGKKVREHLLTLLFKNSIKLTYNLILLHTYWRLCTGYAPRFTLLLYACVNNSRSTRGRTKDLDPVCTPTGHHTVTGARTITLSAE